MGVNCERLMLAQEKHITWRGGPDGLLKIRQHHFSGGNDIKVLADFLYLDAKIVGKGLQLGLGSRFQDFFVKRLQHVERSGIMKIQETVDGLKFLQVLQCLFPELAELVFKDHKGILPKIKIDLGILLYLEASQRQTLGRFSAP